MATTSLRAATRRASSSRSRPAASASACRWFACRRNGEGEESRGAARQTLSCR